MFEEENFKKLQPWIDVKAKEFTLMGYSNISAQDIKMYLIESKWKKVADLSFHQQVTDISTLKPADYMSYALLKTQVYQIDDFDFTDLDDLL